jgi:hypothetical protein
VLKFLRSLTSLENLCIQVPRLALEKTSPCGLLNSLREELKTVVFMQGMLNLRHLPELISKLPNVVNLGVYDARVSEPLLLKQPKYARSSQLFISSVVVSGILGLLGPDIDQSQTGRKLEANRSIQNLFLIGPRQNNEDYKSERELFLDYASIAARLFTFEGLTIRTITLGVRKPPPQRDPAILPRLCHYRVIDGTRGQVVEMVSPQCQSRKSFAS